MILAEKKEGLPEYDLPEKPESAPSQHKRKEGSSGGFGLLAEVSTLAWNLVIPIVGGVLLGYYIDNRTEGGLTWTLSLLVLGILIAFSNLYNLYIEHGQQRLKEDNHVEQHEDKDDQEK